MIDDVLLSLQTIPTMILILIGIGTLVVVLLASCVTLLAVIARRLKHQKTIRNVTSHERDAI